MFDFLFNRGQKAPVDEASSGKPSTTSEARPPSKPGAIDFGPELNQGEERLTGDCSAMEAGKAAPGTWSIEKAATKGERKYSIVC